MKFYFIIWAITSLLMFTIAGVLMGMAISYIKGDLPIIYKSDEKINR